MGYDLHITRAESWLDSETKSISLEEWLNYVQRDVEMRFAIADCPQDRAEIKLVPFDSAAAIGSIVRRSPDNQ